jgi:hypothetical protein
MNISYLLIVLTIIILLICILHYNKIPTYNLAFYTCFYGSENNLAFKIPELPSDKYDCYYFTNNTTILEKIKETKWIGIYDNKPVSNDSIESCMYGKYVKVLPNNTLLQQYEYTCFLDSKLEKISDTRIEFLISNYMVNTDKALLIREHTFMKDGSIWSEYNESLRQERYKKQKDKMLKYIHDKLENGFKETISSKSQCGLLIRNMKHPMISEINKTWYLNIQEAGIQDQISFFFVKRLSDPFC